MRLQQYTVHIEDDFDLDKILASGQCFRPEQCADGRYRFVSGGELLYLRPQGSGKYTVNCAQGAWENVWTNYFDLGRSYSALRGQIAEMPASNAFVRASLESEQGIRILRQEPWEMLITFIISQRKSIPAIRKAVNLLAERYGEVIACEGEEEVHAFPTAQRLAAVPEDELAECGLGYRTPYVYGAAQSVASGALDMAALGSLDDSTLFARLMQLNGVGKKVANCVCLFGYNRTAMAPVDVWVEKLINEEFDGQNPFPQFGQNAGIVQQYLFCYERRITKAKK